MLLFFWVELAPQHCRGRPIYLDTSRCDADAIGAVECSTEMDARRSQIKELLRNVHEAGSIVELDAAEQACADAAPAVVECAGAVSQRRAEIEVPLLLQAQRAASLAELDAAREACAAAVVDCSAEATSREDRITELRDGVRAAATLAQLDAASDAESGTVPLFVDTKTAFSMTN